MSKCVKICALLAFTFLASAQNSKAIDLSATEILKIDGRVEVKKGVNESFKKLNKNLKLAGSLKRLDGGDKIRTFNQSSAEMALKETCILAVKERSLFEVPKTLGPEALTQVRAQQGALLFKVISGSNFEVKTADVIAGVKGTLFELDIIDGFNTIIETPDLEIGTIVQGGTIVNVYRGEVELKHSQTGKARKLGAGESVAVLNKAAMALSNFFKDGYSVLPNFDPESLLKQRFGEEAVQLLSLAPRINELTNFSGIGRINSAIGDHSQRFSSLFPSGFFKKNNIPVPDEYRDEFEIVKGLIDEKYHADFSRYSPPKSAFRSDNRKFKEVYLGNHTFAACKAWAGDRFISLEPTPEGLLLNQGNGIFRCLKFKGNSPELDFIASCKNEDNQYSTSVQVLKGELFARIPGELEYFKIPAGAVTHIGTAGSGTNKWIKAKAEAFDPSLNSYIFSISQKIANERQKVDNRNKKRKIETGKKLLRKFGF